MKYKHKERTNTQTNKPTKGFQFESKKETQIKKRIESKFKKKEWLWFAFVNGAKLF